MRKNRKILIVSSSVGNIYPPSGIFGNMKPLSEKLQEEFRNDNMKLYELVDLANRFRNSIEKGTSVEEGSGKCCYAFSKMVIKKYMRMTSRRDDVLSNEVQVYSCCPGWVRTDMGWENAFRSLEEGVICPVYLVELEHIVNLDLQGQFFYDSKVTSWGI